MRVKDRATNGASKRTGREGGKERKETLADKRDQVSLEIYMKFLVIKFP